LSAALLALLAAGPVMVVAPEPRVAAPDAAWIADAVADALPRQLAELGVPVVERAEREHAQDILELPAFSLTRATSIRLAESLGASRLITGVFEMRGALLELSLRILDVERATLSAPLTAAGPVEGLMGMLRSLAWDVALSGPAPPSGSREDFLARRAPPFDAVRAYARSLGSVDPIARRKALTEAVTLAPDYEDAWLELGRLQLDSREPRAALESLERIAASSRLARQALFLRGLAEQDLGRFREAVQSYAALIDEQPTPAALNNYGLALLRAGSASGPRASQVLRRAVDDAVSPAREALFNLGFALFCEGEYEAAAFWLRGVTERDSRDLHARLVLVWALRRAGHTSEADQEWSALIAVAPSYQSLEAPETSRRFERVLRAEWRSPAEDERRRDAGPPASRR
jgi:tetratricopeptide (TPR) repeat protein